MGSEWTCYKVSEFADIIGGGTPSTKNGEYWNGDIPWLTPKDLSTHSSRFMEKGKRNISILGLSKSSAKIVPKHTVLLTSRAPVGYLAIAKNPICTNQGFRNLVIKDGFDSQFVYYLLKANVEYLKQNASGTTFQELSGSTLKSVEFNIPPLAEQKRIAHILGTLDDKIELNQRMNETLEAMARAIFKAWFVDFEPVKAKLKGEAYPLPDEVMALFPDELVESELGLIPQGWRVKPIEDVVSIYGGGTPSTKKKSKFWENGEFNFVTPKDLSNMRSPILLESDRKVSKAGLERISSGLLPKGTVLMSSRAPVGYLAIVEIPVCINQGFIAMVCDKGVSNYYILNWAMENIAEIKSRASGTTFPEISKRNFRPIPIVVPLTDVINKSVEQVEPLHQKIVANLKESRSLVALRDALLSCLMNGKLRVKGLAD